MGVIDKGSASMHSETDPRWNYVNDDCWVGSLEVPEVIKEKMAEFTKLYGEPPKDLIVSYMKD